MPQSSRYAVLKAQLLDRMQGSALLVGAVPGGSASWLGIPIRIALDELSVRAPVIGPAISHRPVS
jgi:hypothetical protein